MSREVFYRLVDVEVGDAPLRVSVRGTTLTVITRTAYLRTELAEAGWIDHAEYNRIATLVGANPFWLYLDILSRFTENARHRIIGAAPVLRPAAPGSEVCCICLSSGDSAWATATGCDAHRFHAACIARWTRLTCPLCRAPLE